MDFLFSLLNGKKIHAIRQTMSNRLQGKLVVYKEEKLGLKILTS